MIHKSKGIVLRSVKFGETSLVVTMITETLGLQSYLVNGVRTISKKGSTKAGMFQPAAILDVVAYHNDFKNLQRLKEYRWAFIFSHIFSDIKKNAVALFMVELLTKCLKQPEPNAELFYFFEDALLHLDEATDTVTANFPIFFALHLAVFFGFRISDEFAETNTYLDLQEGTFVKDQPLHTQYLQDREAASVAHILKIMQPEDLQEVQLNQEARRNIINSLEIFYAYQIPDFGSLKTLPVLREIMS
jgi:DNA repair protein RecO (recombination protein O)